MGLPPPSPEEERRQRILLAAMTEFSRLGFEQTSTNRIVTEARVGKGTLFYYYPTKRDLYDACVRHALDFMDNEYLVHLGNGAERDFLSLYSAAAKLKMELYSESPEIFHFLASLVFRSDNALTHEQKATLAGVTQKGFAKLYENVDTSKFRKDVPAEQIRKMIFWSMEGFQNELMQRMDGQQFDEVDYEPMWREFDEFLGVLRTVYYEPS